MNVCVPCGITPETYVRESLRLGFPSFLAPKDRLVLVLNAYFDDSGTHDTSDAVSVAGYLSTAEQWEIFDREWAVCMREWGLEYFHMTDFAVRAEPYDAWTDTERRFRFSRLVKIINDHAIASIGVAVPKRDFDQIFPKQAKRHVGGAYGLAATACFQETARIMAEGYPSARIAYIFEAGTKGSGQVKTVFDRNLKDDMQRSELKLLSLKFETKLFSPIQAADIIAYELYKLLPFVIGMQKDHGPRLDDMALLSDCKLRSWIRLNDKELFKWATVISAAAAMTRPQKPRRKRVR